MRMFLLEPGKGIESRKPKSVAYCIELYLEPGKGIERAHGSPGRPTRVPDA